MTFPIYEKIKNGIQTTNQNRFSQSIWGCPAICFSLNQSNDWRKCILTNPNPILSASKNSNPIRGASKKQRSGSRRAPASWMPLLRHLAAMHQTDCDIVKQASGWWDLVILSHVWMSSLSLPMKNTIPIHQSRGNLQGVARNWEMTSPPKKAVPMAPFSLTTTRNPMAKSRQHAPQ